MQAQMLLLSVIFFGALEHGTGVALGLQRLSWKASANKSKSTSKATVNASTTTKVACPDKCSSKWVGGHTAKTQDSVDAWAKRCSWQGCGGCPRCADALAAPAGINLEKVGEKCDSFCSGESYAFKPWETKCTWKSCKGCSACLTSVARAPKVAAAGARAPGGGAKFVKKAAVVARTAEELARFDQAARATEATRAAQTAQTEALDAVHAADAARADAIVKEKAYAEAKAAAKVEADKLSTAFELPPVKLPEVAQTQAKCELWCSSAQYAEKAWETKCSWKDCKDCSSCVAFRETYDTPVAESAAHQKKVVLDRVLTAVSQYIEDDKANVNVLLSNLDLAVLKTDKAVTIDSPLVARDVSFAKTFANINVTVACPESCSSSWVSGQLLDEQQSAKAWEKRCAMSGCGTCPQCVASTLIVGANFGFP